MRVEKLWDQPGDILFMYNNSTLYSMTIFSELAFKEMCSVYRENLSFYLGTDRVKYM